MISRNTVPYARGLMILAISAIAGCASFTELRLAPELQEADKAFNTREYAFAAARYESLGDRYPHGERRERLILRHGISLYTIAAYHDARNVFLAYCKEFPEGLFVADAKNYLDKIDVLMSSDSPAKKEAIEAAHKDLNQLQQLRMQHPHDPAVSYAIGNLYHEIGNHHEAVRYYYDALSLDAAYKEKILIQQRMVIDGEGKPRPATAEELRIFESERQPLVVFNTNDYTARDQEDDINGPQRFYNVTGLIRNQSTWLLQDVEVEVRFYNAQHQILDTQTVRVGSMGPGEVRPFRAEANSYDDLYNITSYSCTPAWGR